MKALLACAAAAVMLSGCLVYDGPDHWHHRYSAGHYGYEQRGH